MEIEELEIMEVSGDVEGLFKVLLSEIDRKPVDNVLYSIMTIYFKQQKVEEIRKQFEIHINELLENSIRRERVLQEFSTNYEDIYDIFITGNSLQNLVIYLTSENKKTLTL